MKTLLVIDDDERVAKTIRGSLATGNEYRVVAAPDGAAGIKAAGKEHPDLILLDINMPDMTGLEVLKLLKAEPSTAQIPVIMLTGDDAKESIEEAVYEYAEEYIVKPFEMPHLRVRIERILALTSR